ncbi:MAG TPA: hypothetical protein VLT62_11985 [Candidatus Methylomirabilis sp.]|nr:hypothetical protein [Candidatus Methylomirabilis sp.]
MIAVSEKAKEVLLDWKQSAPATEVNLTLRLALSPAGWEVHPDTPRAGDVVVEYQETPVLIIQERASGLLREFTLDCRETVERTRLVLVAN